LSIKAFVEKGKVGASGVQVCIAHATLPMELNLFGVTCGYKDI